MSKVGSWSTTAGNNNSAPPDGFPEGQAPSTLNDGVREMMAQIRAVWNDAQYFDQGWTPTYISSTSFSVAGDQTSAIHAGRKLKLFDGSTFYATVQTASFTAVTTIQVEGATGALTTSLSSFALSVLARNNDALPNNVVRAAFNRVTGTAQSAVAGAHYFMQNAGQSNLTLPVSPVAGDVVYTTFENTLVTNVILRNGQKIMGTAADLTVDIAQTTVGLRFDDSTFGWRLL